MLKQADRDEKRNQGAVDKQQSIWKLPSITQPNCPISRRYCPHTTSRFQPQGHTLATTCHDSTTCCQLRRNLPHLPSLLRILCHAIWQFYHASAHYTIYDLHLNTQHIPSRSHSDPTNHNLLTQKLTEILTQILTETQTQIHRLELPPSCYCTHTKMGARYVPLPLPRTVPRSMPLPRTH